MLELLLKGAKENIQLPDKPNIPLPEVEITPVKVKPDIEKVADSIKKTYDDAMDFISERKSSPTPKTPVSLKPSPDTQAIFEEIRKTKKRERESDIGLPRSINFPTPAQETPAQETPAPPQTTPRTVNTIPTPRTEPPPDIDSALIEQFTAQNLGREAFGAIVPKFPFKPTIDQQYDIDQIETVARRRRIGLEPISSSLRTENYLLVPPGVNIPPAWQINDDEDKKSKKGAGHEKLDLLKFKPGVFEVPDITKEFQYFSAFRDRESSSEMGKKRTRGISHYFKKPTLDIAQDYARSIESLRQGIPESTDMMSGKDYQLYSRVKSSVNRYLKSKEGRELDNHLKSIKKDLT